MSLVLPYIDFLLTNSYIGYVFLIGFLAYIIFILFRR